MSAWSPPKRIAVSGSLSQVSIVDLTIKPVAPSSVPDPPSPDDHTFGRHESSKVVERRPEAIAARLDDHLRRGQDHRLVKIGFEVDEGHASGTCGLNVPRPPEHPYSVGRGPKLSRTAPGLPEAPTLERMEPWRTQDTPKYSPEVRERAVRMVFEHAASTPRSGRRSARSRRRSAARRRRCGTGSGRPSATRASEPGRPPTSGSGSRRWSARSASCARPTRSCARRQRVFRPGGARPPAEVMIASSTTHRDAYGVEPICQVLPIAPSTYYAHAARRRSRRGCRRARATRP